ncbi:hypothetical protein EMCRGX_G014164 [Ephydatia muelleri]
MSSTFLVTVDLSNDNCTNQILAIRHNEITRCTLHNNTILDLKDTTALGSLLHRYKQWTKQVAVNSQPFLCPVAVTSDERVLNAWGGKREDLGSSRIRRSKYSQMERPMNGDKDTTARWMGGFVDHCTCQGSVDHRGRLWGQFSQVWSLNGCKLFWRAQRISAYWCRVALSIRGEESLPQDVDTLSIPEGTYWHRQKIHFTRISAYWCRMALSIRGAARTTISLPPLATWYSTTANIASATVGE